MKLYILNKFTYDQVTGEFINNSTVLVGDTYRGNVHKFIWMMFNNWREPGGIIDHINGNTMDNTYVKLRILKT